MLQKLLLSGVALATLTFSGHAADLPRRVPAATSPVAAPVFSWTGFYAGGNLGAGWERTSVIFPPQTQVYFGAVSQESFYDIGAGKGGGVTGGVQVGYDQQMGSMVLGLQAAIDASSIKARLQNADYPTDYFATKPLLVGSLTGRIGYLLQPSLLVYVSGGPSWQYNRYTEVYVDPSDGYSVKGSALHWGWTVGGGLEYALTSNWSTFVQYNHSDYSAKNATLSNAGEQNRWQYRYTNRLETVLVGFNYRFKS